jgi:uncharacterized protein YktB (UPF0637 family)
VQLFIADDFRIFDIPGFHERMAAIASQVRPKLASAGETLAPGLGALVDAPLHPHVAKHARRTVNPPDDTWVAFSANRRGYKKSVHFKLAVSRNAVRLLCEVGPEFADKARWLSTWNRECADVARGLRRAPGLAWFRNEHDESATIAVGELSAADLRKLAESLVQKRDGQFVLGRRFSVPEYLKLKAHGFEKIALETYAPMAALFRIM